MKKTYIITGANRGLGQSLYKKIRAEEERALIIVVNRSAMPEYLSSEIDIEIRCDLSETKILEQEIQNVMSKITTSDLIVFINNASIITPIQSSHTLSSDDHLHSFKVNCLAPTIITSFLLRSFDPSSLIFVNITSGAANRPIWGWDLYCSTKSYTKMHFDVLGIENKTLRVIQFDPGVLDTDMQKSIRDASGRINELANFKELHETGKLKSPDAATQELLELLKS